MKQILFILSFLITCSIYANAQNANTIRLDSIRAANKAKSDSIKAVIAARKDSLQQLRKVREEKKKEAARAKKRKKKNEPLDEFSQNNFTKEDSVREFKQDSIKTARALEVEKRKQEKEVRKEILLSKRKKIIPPLTQELNGGFRLNTDGWSVFLNRGFIDESAFKTTFFTLDFSERKHPKEVRIINENFSTVYPNEVKPIAYKYGKVNNFYQFKIGYGAIRQLSGKLDSRNVVIHWVYAGGLSIGLLKPYYLDLLVPEGSGYVRKFAKYDTTIHEYFLDTKNRGTILGGSYFTRGIGETIIKPGFHARSGFNFDYATSRKSFIAVEIGASIEYYFKSIEIMKNTRNNAYFINLYADFRFGRKWE